MSEWKRPYCSVCGCHDERTWIYDEQVCLACTPGKSAKQARPAEFCERPGLPAFLADKTSAAVLIETAERELREARVHIDSLTALLAAATLRLKEGAR